MDIQKVSIDKLNPAKYNPRKDLKPGDKEYEKLKRSIQEFGYVEPIIWNKQTGNVVGGHQRLKVLQEMGQTEIDCVVIDLPEDREKALNVALNKIQGEWDVLKLSELIAELDKSMFDITLTGFDAAEIDELMESFHSTTCKQDEFDVDKAYEDISQKETLTQKGDIWRLGRHRLMCGDSTKYEDFLDLMDGQKAQLCVTSPPYGVGKDYEKKGIEPWFETMRPVIKNVCRFSEIVCWNLGDLYATGSQFIEPTTMYSLDMFREQGFRPIWIRIWEKQGMNFGVGPYHLVSNKPVQQYEYISALADVELQKQTEEDIPDEYNFLVGMARHNYKFVRRLTKEERKNWGYKGIWRINTVRANKEHPAMFPVELPWRCIKMHSDRGGVILEPFCGSGTTIIAAEQLERSCFGMEISPVYCDLAIRRWEEFTGQKAERICNAYEEGGGNG
ncbi:site-specific DNA-methyltransferase [Desulfotomaculum varum]